MDQHELSFPVAQSESGANEPARALREPNTFSTCIADPPWPYGRGPKAQGFVDDRYPVMKIDDLCALPVKELKLDYLFLWVAKKFLFNSDAGSRVMKAWGFEPKSALVWHKNTGSGVGSWFKSDVEFVLLGTAPHAPFIRTAETDFFKSPRSKHSEKPPYIHELIERKFPGPYLELFARRKRPGWTALGNQVPGDETDIRESLERLICKRR